MDENHTSGMMTRRRFSTLLAGLAASVALARRGFGQSAPRPLRVAISVDTLAGANVNDARAAYRVWSQEVSNILGVRSAELVPDVFIPSEQIVRMIRQGTIDLFGITAWEYAQVVQFVDPSSILLEDSEADGLEYVLVVRNDSPFKELSDLRGGHLTTHHHRDMNLLPAWIGNLLAASNLPPMDVFFGDQVMRDSITQVVLPVFFRRMDAAGLERRHFDTAVELNPQLGKDLHALIVSPKVIPISLCFQKNCSPEGKKLLMNAIAKVESIPAGQQIVALYQSRKLVPRTASCMNSTLEMLHQYARVQARAPGPRKERP
jgi:ABC-type phosphate/phosphonate transport system substrate-binding protein